MNSVSTRDGDRGYRDLRVGKSPERSISVAESALEPKVPAPLKLSDAELKSLFKNELTRFKCELADQVRLEITAELTQQFDKNTASQAEVVNQKTRLLDEQTKRLECLFTELSETVASAVDDSKKSLAKSAKELAYCAVLELVSNQQLYSDLIKDSIAKQLDLISADEEATIKCAQSDYEFIHRALPSDAKIKLIDSYKISPGCYELETSLSMFKIGLSDQVLSLQKLFFDEK